LYTRLRPFGPIWRGFPSRVVPSGLCKPGLPLTPSLNTEIAFARSNFFDIAPAFTSLGPISLLLSLRLAVGSWQQHAVSYFACKRSPEAEHAHSLFKRLPRARVASACGIIGGLPSQLSTSGPIPFLNRPWDATSQIPGKLVCAPRVIGHA
jgi:hypothetical protein